MKESLSTVFAILLISCSLAVTACKHQPSALERRKAEIKEKDSIELSKAREGLRVADSVATFKAFEVEDLKKLFVFEKQEKYQTVGYYVQPAYQGGKERFTFFPEVEEGGKLLFVFIDKQRKYSFTEVDLEASDYMKLLPKSLTDAQRRDVERCYDLAKAIHDLSEAQKQQEKLRLKVRFYEEKSSRMSGSASASSSIKIVKPSQVIQMPSITKEKWATLMEQVDRGETNIDDIKYGDLTVYNDLYSESCSWYCGGDVKQLTASGCHARAGRLSYEGKNAHDFNHESVWATNGDGIGQSLTYTFAGECPRITTVKILNGYVKDETSWRNNSRVKRLRMFYNGKPYAELALEDSRTLQCFEVGTLGYHDSKKSDWTLRFEILDVYSGAKYKDAVIAELYFDGIDVH